MFPSPFGELFRRNAKPLVAPSHLIRFRPLSGNYSGETFNASSASFSSRNEMFPSPFGELFRRNKYLQEILDVWYNVSVPFRGIIQAKHSLISSALANTSSFRPLSGNYSGETLIGGLLNHEYVWFPSPFGELFRRNHGINRPSSLAVLFPSPFGELFRRNCWSLKLS